MTTSTKILHSISADSKTGSITTPIYQTSTFVQEAPGKNHGYDYARSNNPTREVLEKLIATLEEGHSGFAFATGLAAIDSVLKLLQKGDEIIAVDDIYGGAYRLFTEVYEKFGIKIHYVDTSDLSKIESKINSNTKFIWIETPTNPTLKISDISAIAELTKKTDILLVVDNTFASPVHQKPLQLGADIVVHSATKYLAGHSDLVAGLVVCKSEELSEKIKFIQNSSGGVLGPWDTFLTIRGIETLILRFQKQSENALQVAQKLLEHPLVDQVYYPGLEIHKNHKIAAKQQGRHFGGVVSFSLKDDTVEAAKNVIKNTQSFQLAESLGGVKSLVCIPSLMTHASVPREKRISAGVQDSLIRLSCGIEESEDLEQDILSALNVSQLVNLIK